MENTPPSDAQPQQKLLSPLSVRRVDSFSDGVLAIAMTLLVLDLRVDSFVPGRLSTMVSSQRFAYVAFLISFIYIGVMWINHSSTFHNIRGVTTPLLWANLGVLLSAVVLPYPTAVLAAAFRDGNVVDERTAIELYGFLAFVMGISWSILLGIIWRSPQLWTTPRFGPIWRKVTLWTLGGAFGHLIAVVLGLLTTPRVGVVLFVALIFLRANQARRIYNEGRKIRDHNIASGDTA